MGVSPFEKLPGAMGHLDALLALARHPQVAVKATAVPSMSNEAYPFTDTFDVLKAVYDAFGPHRLFWGSDVTRMRCSWTACKTQFTDTLDWLTGDDLNLVMGRAVCNWLGIRG